MLLSELKLTLNKIKTVEFTLPDGSLIPNHFHVTEVGQIDKRFIDCGGVLRKEAVINFQLYTADDFDHRLSIQKFKSLLDLSEKALLLDDLEIEVEYQTDTIGKYSLGFKNSRFFLISSYTACLANDQCGIPESKITTSKCTPDSNCC
tara:strand:- start:191 stop:634 length:444 start_codon:yes stop_codon:yes gene_type:complete